MVECCSLKLLLLKYFADKAPDFDGFLNFDKYQFSRRLYNFLRLGLSPLQGMKAYHKNFVFLIPGSCFSKMKASIVILRKAYF